MNLLPRINLADLLMRTLILILLSFSPALADYHNLAVTDRHDADYWLDQGALFATYGNYSKAVEAYQKALALDASNSKAHYDIALAYGELEKPDQALAEINRAIALDARQNQYYYGRAWLLLKSGHSSQAMDDFQKAADMGNLDAITFLESVGQD
jgi:tetratricopeptide (TPR) repeat protein